MLLLLSLGLAANAMLADSRGYDALNRTHNPSKRDYKLAGRAAEAKQIAASEAADRAFYEAEQVRQEKLAENTKIAADKLSKQQRFDRQQEDAAGAGKQARIAAVAEEWRKMYEDQQIERVQGLNGGVFGAPDAGRKRNADEYAARRAQVERQVAEARFMQRRIQLEGERLAELTDSALAMGDRVQAATDAAAWAPRFERMEEEAEQDELQQRFRDRRAQHKIAVAEAKARLEQIAAEQAEIAFQKKEIKRLRQKNNRARAAANKREAARLESAFGPEAEREARRLAAEEQMLHELQQRNEQLEQQKSYLRKFIEWAGLQRFVDQPRHPDYPVVDPVYPTEFVKESALF